MDLAVLLTPPIRWLRLKTLLWQLPPSSRTAAELRGFAYWSTSDHLMATLVNLDALGLWRAMGSKPQHKPDLITRPGEKPEGVEVIKGGSMTPQEYVEWRKSGFVQPDEAVNDGG